MKNILLLLGTLVLPALAAAQTPVADPAIPVPPVLYRSVFADTPSGVETESVDWKTANAEVGQFRKGHADILKWEAEQAGHTTGASQALPTSVPMPIHSPAPSPEPVKP